MENKTFKIKSFPLTNGWKKKIGITILEFLIVVSILVLMASLVVVEIAEARKKSRDGKRKADISVLQKIIEIYQTDNNTLPGEINKEYKYNGTSDDWIPDIVPNYVKKIPKDPFSGKNTIYEYRYKNNGQDYEIDAIIENQEDPSIKEDGGNDDTRYERGTNLTIL